MSIRLISNNILIIPTGDEFSSFQAERRWYIRNRQYWKIIANERRQTFVNQTQKENDV